MMSFVSDVVLGRLDHRHHFPPPCDQGVRRSDIPAHTSNASELAMTPNENWWRGTAVSRSSTHTLDNARAGSSNATTRATGLFCHAHFWSGVTLPLFRFPLPGFLPPAIAAHLWTMRTTRLRSPSPAGSGRSPSRWTGRSCHPTTSRSSKQQRETTRRASKNRSENPSPVALPFGRGEGTECSDSTESA